MWMRLVVKVILELLFLRKICRKAGFTICSINYFLGRHVKLDNEINSILVIDLIYHVVAVSFNKWYSERLKLVIWYQFLLGVILPLYMLTYILPIRYRCTCITLNNPSISKQSTNTMNTCRCSSTLFGDPLPVYIYICKCFSLYDINNKIDIQFCMNTFDDVI